MTPIINSFTTYHLTESEQQEQHILPELVRVKLQNQRVYLQQEKSAMVVDAKEIPLYLQREAELQGQILLLTTLLREHEDELVRRKEEMVVSAAKNNRS